MYKLVSYCQPAIAAFIQDISAADPRYNFLTRHSGIRNNIFSIAYLSQVLLSYCTTPSLMNHGRFIPDEIMRAHLGQGIAKANEANEAKGRKTSDGLPFCYIHTIITFYRLPPSEEIREYRQDKHYIDKLYSEYNELINFRQSLRGLSVKEDVSDDEKDKCSICLKSLSNHTIQTLTTCGHRFHKRCITQWLKTKDTCPLCRAST